MWYISYFAKIAAQGLRKFVNWLMSGINMSFYAVRIVTIIVLAWVQSRYWTLQFLHLFGAFEAIEQDQSNLSKKRLLQSHLTTVIKLINSWSMPLSYRHLFKSVSACGSIECSGACWSIECSGGCRDYLTQYSCLWVLRSVVLEGIVKLRLAREKQNSLYVLRLILIHTGC